MAEYLSRLFEPYLWSWLTPILAYGLAAMVPIFLIINLVAVGALFFIWLERKISARIQDRLGPTRVGGKFGWLQTLADGLKLITKEDLCPGGADVFLFRIAPYISFCASFAAYLAIPFAGGNTFPLIAQRLNVGIFFTLAVLGLEVFGVILAGYASASKWSLFGAMREAAQVVSYEVPLGLCAAVPVLVVGSMDMVLIGDQQAGFFTNWLMFHNPFMFITFIIFSVCALASVNRAPFDLAEAESELVAGFHTEYSGLRWSFFFMAEYGSMTAVSLLGAILFCGGWHGPIPIASILTLTYEHGFWWGYIGSLIGVANILFKAVIGVSIMMWIRWTLPRLRIDQVMTTCWKYCTPIVCVMFFGTTLWIAMFPGGMGIIPGNIYGNLREPQDPTLVKTTVEEVPENHESTEPVKKEEHVPEAEKSADHKSAVVASPEVNQLVEGGR